MRKEEPILNEIVKSATISKEAIEVYLTDCKNDGIEPEKPFKGSFNVRVSPKLHQKAALLAMEDKMSLNNFVAESIRTRIFKETGSQI